MQNKRVLTLCEAALMVAASYVLSFLEIPVGMAFGGYGGSINFVMLPLIVLAIRHGGLWGMGAGLVFGTLKFFGAGGVAVNWQSMLLDYSLAYMAVGVAGFVGKKLGVKGAGVTAFIGCLARFAVHYLSGVTIYAEYMPSEFLGLTMTGPSFYSLLYNGSYMLPNTIIAVVCMALLAKPLEKLLFQNRE